MYYQWYGKKKLRKMQKKKEKKFGRKFRSLYAERSTIVLYSVTYGNDDACNI